MREASSAARMDFAGASGSPGDAGEEFGRPQSETLAERSAEMAVAGETQGNRDFVDVLRRVFEQGRALVQAQFAPVFVQAHPDHGVEDARQIGRRAMQLLR